MTEQIINDLTIQAATVNGSGSQTANLVLTRAIFKMGIPVAPKNVFPSNIEGLPTWFSIRLSPDGYQCRTDDVDVLVALNPTTWQRDIQGVNAGAAVIHEATYPVVGIDDSHPHVFAARGPRVSRYTSVMTTRQLAIAAISSATFARFE